MPTTTLGRVKAAHQLIHLAVEQLEAALDGPDGTGFDEMIERTTHTLLEQAITLRSITDKLDAKHTPVSHS